MAAGVVISQSKINENSLLPACSSISSGKRKHRFTLLIGYGESAGSLLKRIEQLKCRMGINKNFELLTLLLDFFEQNNSQFQSNTVATITTTHDLSMVSDQGMSIISYKKLLDDRQNECTVQELLSSEDNKNDQFIINSSFSAAASPLLEADNGVENQGVIILSQNNMEVNNSVDSKVEKSLLIDSTMTVGPNCLDFHQDLSNENKDDKEIIEPVKKKFILDRKVTEDIYQDLSNDSSITLLSSQVDYTAAKLVCECMDHIKKDGSYFHGYIHSTEKLRNFLDMYRKLTRTSFTVRSSRSYIKKRAVNALKSLKASHFVGKKNPSQTLEPSVSFSKETVHDMMNINDSLTTQDYAGKNYVELSDLVGCETSVKEDFPDQIELADDAIVTGPLRWEYVLGKPPIPFTGVPFFIIGNTQYQCLFASPDIRTQRRKHELEKCTKDNVIAIKSRVRRSLKRDCKAVMCIKSVVSFPEYTVQEKITEIKSKKGCRKLKAAQLDKVRQAISKGDSIGHPAFWVYVPLPEAHATHEDEIDFKEESFEGHSAQLDEISQILNAASQFGNHVHVVQKDGKIVELKISDGENGTTIDVPEAEISAPTTN